MVQALVVRSSKSASLPHCQTSHTPLGLIISKVLRGKSYLSSLSPPRCVNIVALLYKKVGHEQSVRFSLKSTKIRFKIHQPPSATVLAARLICCRRNLGPIFPLMPTLALIALIKSFGALTSCWIRDALGLGCG